VHIRSSRCVDTTGDDASWSIGVEKVFTGIAEGTKRVMGPLVTWVLDIGRNGETSKVRSALSYHFEDNDFDLLNSEPSGPVGKHATALTNLALELTTTANLLPSYTLMLEL